MPRITTFGSATARGYGYSAGSLIAGNSGILTSGSSYTLPLTSGTFINILVIGAGAGGGGGSGRIPTWSGYSTGGGGGGAGGNAYALNVPVVPGQTISYSIGSAGSAGDSRNGIYSSGSGGGSGGTTSVTVASVLKAAATGGSGGAVSPGGGGGSAGSASTGTQLLSPTAGSTALTDTYTGGNGGNGYTINTTVGLSLASILTLGSAGYGGVGYSGGVNATSVAYGGGGGGGGCAQTDRCFEWNCSGVYPAAGAAGAVFIWWGY